MSELLVRETQALRGSGGRMTAQRRTIIQTLERMGGHPTADEIYAASRACDTQINPSTVYRTLSWLEQAGLLSPAWLGPERCRRQEPLSETLPPGHHHFVCSGCGQVLEFRTPDIEAVKAAFARAHGARVTRATLTLYGQCAACRAAEEHEVGHDE